MMAKRLPLPEFVGLIAILSAMIAFSTDAMLPAMPEIASDLSLSDPNRAQLVITIFLLGTGLGQLFMGPISDALGRKPVITIGILIFVCGCTLAYFARSLELMLVARFIQGIGVSAHRAVVMAMVRDLFSGRLMARVMSFSMMIFVLVPALAPSIGQLIMLNFGWRSIYIAFVVFAMIGFAWLNLRQPESLDPANRRALRLANFKTSFLEILRSRVVVIYVLALSFAFGSLFAYLSSAQQVFVITFGADELFPLYFALIALVSGSAGFVNASLVVRIGMRNMARFAFAAQSAVSVLIAAVLLTDVVPVTITFPVFLFWSIHLFFMSGLIFGNLTALAMEPMGHIAGFASAIIGSVSTALSVVIAIPIGQLFNGTALPLVVGVAVCSVIGLALMQVNPKDA